MGSVTHLQRDQQIGRRMGWDEFYCLGCSEDWLDDEYFGPNHEPVTAEEAHNCEVILVCDSCECDLLPVVYTIQGVTDASDS